MFNFYFLCEWIEKAEEVHDGFYLYDKIDHLGGPEDEITVICPLHGEYTTTFADHAIDNNTGICPLCRKEIISAIDKNNNEILNKNIELSDIDYLNPDKYIKNLKLQNNTVGNYYVYAFVDDPKYPEKIKIGVSIDPYKRLKRLQKDTPFPVFIFKIFDCKTRENAYTLESMVHKFFEKQNCDFKGFEGATEWMIYTPKILTYINKVMIVNSLV